MYFAGSTRDQAVSFVPDFRLLWNVIHVSLENITIETIVMLFKFLDRFLSNVWNKKTNKRLFKETNQFVIYNNLRYSF